MMKKEFWRKLAFYLRGDLRVQQDHARTVENLDRIQEILQVYATVVERAVAARALLAEGKFDGHTEALGRLWAEIDRYMEKYGRRGTE